MILDYMFNYLYLSTRAEVRVRVRAEMQSMFVTRFVICSILRLLMRPGVSVGVFRDLGSRLQLDF